MITLQELTQANIKTLSVEQLDQLHRGAHRGARGGGEYNLLMSAHKLLSVEQIRRGVKHDTPLNLTKPSIHAIYLKSPHGTLIADGRKRAIAKSHPVRGMEGKRIIVSKENGIGLAFGMAMIGEPEQLTTEQFDKRFDEHRVTSKERNRWWPDEEKLILYPIFNFTPYDDPRHVEVPPGTQTLMQDIKFTTPPPDLLQMPAVPTIVTKGENVMPWKPSDATRFTREADTPKKRRRWAEVANSALARCLADDGDRKKCEASAIRQANSVIKHKKEIEKVQAAIDEALDTTAIMEVKIETPATFVNKAQEPNQTSCTCPNCKEVSEHESGTPCNEIECPKCGSMLRGGDSEKTVVAERAAEMSSEVVQHIIDAVIARVREEKEKAEVAPIVEAVLVEPEPDPTIAKAGRRVRKDKLAKLKELFAQLKDLIGWAAYEDIIPDLVLPPAKAFKGDGRTWLMLWTTNSYIDRDDEIFRIKAIQDYVERYTNNPIKGEFQFWHIPGTKFGNIVWQAVVADRFLVQMGTFDDTPIGNAFKVFLTSHPNSHPNIAPTGWGASHGYNYVGSDRADGVYDWFNTIESSVLPMVYAANLHNPNPVILGGKEMDKMQTDALRAISEEVGVDLVDIVEKTGQQKKAELDEFVEHKSKEGAEGDAETPAVETEQPIESEPVIAKSASDELQASEEGEEAIPDTNTKEIVEATLAQVAELLQLESLSDTIKGLQESQEANSAQVAGLVEDLTSRVAQLEQSDEKKIAERMPTLPQLAWFRASQAKQTVLTPDDKNLASAKPRGEGPVLPIPKGLS